MGQTVEEIASERGVSIHTVRAQVRGVTEKTGSRRQADVTALLGGIRHLRMTANWARTRHGIIPVGVDVHGSGKLG
jgi:predicted transcriptional regulator